MKNGIPCYLLSEVNDSWSFRHRLVFAESCPQRTDLPGYFDTSPVSTLLRSVDAHHVAHTSWQSQHGYTAHPLIRSTFEAGKTGQVGVGKHEAPFGGVRRSVHQQPPNVAILRERTESRRTRFFTESSLAIAAGSLQLRTGMKGNQS